MNLIYMLVGVGIGLCFSEMKRIYINTMKEINYEIRQEKSEK